METPTPIPQPVSITLNVSGDLLWHDSYFEPAAQNAAAKGEEGMDFYPFLESATNYVSSADWAICQNELPYAAPECPYSGYPSFKTPPDAAKAVAKTGWDMCSTTSNHTMDAGDEHNHQPNQQQIGFVQAVSASPDVDFIYGQHAHVSQPIAKVNGKWVVYGTGNVTGMMLRSGWPDVYEGYFAQITLQGFPGEKFEATKMEWAPLAITSDGKVQLIPDELKKGAANAEELEASAARTRAIVTSMSDELVEYTGA